MRCSQSLWSPPSSSLLIDIRGDVAVEVAGDSEAVHGATATVYGRARVVIVARGVTLYPRCLRRAGGRRGRSVG